MPYTVTTSQPASQSADASESRSTIQLISSLTNISPIRSDLRWDAPVYADGSCLDKGVYRVSLVVERNFPAIFSGIGTRHESMCRFVEGRRSAVAERLPPEENP